MLDADGVRVRVLQCVVDGLFADAAWEVVACSVFADALECGSSAAALPPGYPAPFVCPGATPFVWHGAPPSTFCEGPLSLRAGTPLARERGTPLTGRCPSCPQILSQLSGDHSVTRSPSESLNDPAAMMMMSMSAPIPRNPRVKSQRIPVPILPT